MAALSSELVQTCCVAIGEHGVLIESRLGEARVDMALRLIDRGATLVAGAQTLCLRKSGALEACAPAGEAGRIEVRGLGAIAMDHAERVPVSLLLVLLDDAPRFPDEARARNIAGVDVPVLALEAQDLAAPIKTELWLNRR